MRGNGYDRLPHNERDGYAAFGDVTISFTDTLDLSLGVRYHEENVFSEQRVFINGVTAPRPLVSESMACRRRPVRWHAGHRRRAAGLAARVHLRQGHEPLCAAEDVQRRLMGYVSYAEGFNSGGVATPTIQGVRELLPLQAADDRDVRARAALGSRRRPLRFNATLFDTAWKDFQSAGVVYDAQGRQVPQLQTTNVGDAAAQGVEFELTYLPIESLMINVSVGLLDTEYTELPPGQTSGHVVWTSATEFSRAPDTSYSIGLEHTANLVNGGSLQDARGLQLPGSVLAQRAVPAHGRLSVRSGRHL